MIWSEAIRSTDDMEHIVEEAMLNWWCCEYDCAHAQKLKEELFDIDAMLRILTFLTQSESSRVLAGWAWHCSIFSQRRGVKRI